MKPHFTNTGNPVDFPKLEMNERILKLAREAAGGMLSYDEDGYRLSEQEVKKFAELIVRECMQVTVNYPHPVTKLTAAEHIARHFGVER